MPNYKQTDVMGTSWQRSYAVAISNKTTEIPKITFYEEEIINIQNKVITNHIGQIEEYFVQPERKFQLLNPLDDTLIGQEATYQDLYVLLYSLYNHLAKRRDDANSPQVEQPVEPIQEQQPSE